MNLVIEGKTYINGSFQNYGIGIDDGKITAIKKILKGDTHLDFGNKLILPAGIDIHVHFREPGLIYKEDFSSGSVSAAFGGISCVFDMPNTIPQTTTLKEINKKINLASKKSFVDFGVYCGVTNNNIQDIETLATKCNGFKIYLGSSTNTLLFDKKNLKDALQNISKTNKPVLFHAEDEELLLKNKKVENNLLDHIRARPSICEVNSIKDIFKESQKMNLNIHICHISSIEGLELLKNRPKTITCGLTPHHALISAEKNNFLQTYYKVNPPIRSSFDKESLFNAVKNGIIDIIESDHAPHTKEEKETIFNIAPSGMPGVETMLPLFLFFAKKEVIPFSKVISLLCEKPADLLNVPKGYIQIGKDADLIVVDIKKEAKIKSESLHSKCKWSTFEGWEAIFPTHVFIRGENVIEDNEIQVSQGFGRFVGE
jgi:dihydroorotase